jgi:predicted PurR-regulated permease PerM
MTTDTKDLEARLFGTVERRLFKATAVLLALVILALLVGVVIWGLMQVLSFFYKLILPLSVAGVLALVLYPVVDYLETRLRVPRIVAVSVIVLLFLVAIAGLILLLVPTLIQQLIQLGDTAPAIISGWQDYLTSRFPALTRMVSERLENGDLADAVPEVKGTGKKAMGYVGIVVGLGFVPLFLFFMLLSGRSLQGRAEELFSVFSTPTQQRIMYFMNVFVGHVTAFFQGQLVIAVIMGAMLAAGFTIIGLKGGLVFGLVLGLLNIVPFLGTLVGLLFVLPMAYLQPGGGLQLLGLSLLVFTIVQLIESWLLTPKIMSNRSGLHPALVVISVFFWGTALGGVIGMILAVPLTAFLVAVWSQLKDGLARSMKSDLQADRIETPPGVREEASDPEPDKVIVCS